MRVIYKKLLQLENGQLNSLVIINVKSYINYYLGKYISCFCNSKCNGEVIIGINDDAEITGIPFQGDINMTLVKNFVFEYMTANVKGLDDFNKVSINIEKLNRSIDFIEDDIYGKIKNLNKKRKYDKIMNKYIRQRKEWIGKFQYYSRKFSE